MKQEVKNNSFVVYATHLGTIEQIETYDKDLAYKVMKAIFDYGIYNQYDESDPQVNSYMVSIIDNIDRAQKRHEESKANGSTGGRSRKFDRKAICDYVREGHTNKEAAEKFDCSTKSVQRYLKEGY